MCLAIPGEILSVHGGEPAEGGQPAKSGEPAKGEPPGGELRTGRVSFGGLVKDVCLACVPEARVGDFVLVHAGFAITVVSPEHAREVIAYLESIGESAEAAEPDAAAAPGQPAAGPQDASPSRAPGGSR